MPSLSGGKFGGEEEEEEEEGGDAVTGDVCVMVGGGVGGDGGESSSTTWMGGVTIRGIGESMIDSLLTESRFPALNHQRRRLQPLNRSGFISEAFPSSPVHLMYT